MRLDHRGVLLLPGFSPTRFPPNQALPSLCMRLSEDVLSPQPLTWHNSSVHITEAQDMCAVCRFQELGKPCRGDRNCSCAETYHWLGGNALPHLPANLARKAHSRGVFHSLPPKFMLLFTLPPSSHFQTLRWCLHCATSSHGARTGPSEPAGERDKDPSSGPWPWRLGQVSLGPRTL